jgi:hypothetical protein
VLSVVVELLEPIPTLYGVDVEVDERAARRTLRDQIARLERDLAAAFTASFPTGGLDTTVASRGGPRLLDLGELEALRDDLAERLQRARVDLEQRAREQSQYRVLIERMLAEPGAHKWVRVCNADIGEQGCRSWHVRPRLGIVGMLMGWWRVKISSGCPLGRGPRLTAAAPLRSTR